MRILHVEDHTLFRDAMVHLIRSFDPEAVIFSAATASEALAAVSHYPDLDLLLLDLGLPGTGGLSIISSLLDKAPTVPIVVLSASEEPPKVHAALQLGAAGYIPKTASSEEMKHAFQVILNGDVYLPSGLLSTLEHSQDAPLEEGSGSVRELTQRQLEVLELLGTGLSNKAVAKRLSLSEGTVKLHVSAILRALDARNRTDAVIEATRRGWLQTGA